MMKRYLYMAVVCLGLVLLGQSAMPVTAQSLWSDSGAASNMFADHKAHAVGDSITILISETSTSSRTGSSSNKKSGSTDVTAGTGLLTFIDSASASGTDSFSSSGSISNTNKVSASMTAQVVEVKPNGTLVISGSQKIKQNTEEQTITITGTVRPEDITANNTISSTYIANADIQITGKGPISNKQKQGIITQLFNFLF